MFAKRRAHLICGAITGLALSACGPAPVPNDVTQGVGFQDYEQYMARREALSSPAPQTVQPPADVTAEPFAPPTAGALSSGTGTAPPRSTGATDLASLAASAIAEAEAASGTARSDAAPRPPGIVAGGDDFTAPPLPEGTPVIGANVAAFALSTTHTIGERVYRRFPLRLGRPEVRCGDFRTTDLAQDWFLENGGPERDPAGLDPNGDGFACNWDPERYRAQARAARSPRPQASTGASFTTDG